MPEISTSLYRLARASGVETMGALRQWHQSGAMAATRNIGPRLLSEAVTLLSQSHADDAPLTVRTAEGVMDPSAKRLYYITPENRAELEKRAPRTAPQGGGRANTTIPLNAMLSRYAAFCEAGLRRVFAALPDEADRRFIRHVLMGIATDDVTLTEDPTAYLRDIAEAAQEYDAGEEPFTPALLSTLHRFGPLEALALVDWVEQEKAKGS